MRYEKYITYSQGLYLLHVPALSRIETLELDGYDEIMEDEYTVEVVRQQDGYKFKVERVLPTFLPFNRLHQVFDFIEQNKALMEVK